MALNFSTGLKNGVLSSSDLKTLFDGGFVSVYSGTVPANADADLAAAVLLCTYSDDGQVPGGSTGLTLDSAAVAGAIAKNPVQVWKGTAAASGTASFFRFEELLDDGSSSTTAIRIQGIVGGAGADMFVQSTTFTSAVEYTIDYFSVAVPDA